MEGCLPAATESTLLRIVLGDDRMFGMHAFYQQVVLAAHSMGLAGATVTRGVAGYGPASRDVQPLLPLAARPVIIEIIDSAEKIAAFLAAVRGTLQDALVTVQKVAVLSAAKPASASSTPGGAPLGLSSDGGMQ